MSENTIEMREHTGKGFEQLLEIKKDEMGALNGFIEAVFKDGALDLKTKEAIAVAISVYSRCPYCIAGHVKNALGAGLTKEQIIEAATVAMAFGGGPAMAYSSTILMDALNEIDE